MSTKVPFYQWRARSYAWAKRAIAQAEAVHGPPKPTCDCGRLLPERRSRDPHARCDTCDPPYVPPVMHFIGPRDEPACRIPGDTIATDNPRKVTCGACLRTRVLAAARAPRMVTA